MDSLEDAQGAGDASTDPAKRNMSVARESLLQFPCEFPIKVLGQSHPDFIATITALVRQFDLDLDLARIETRPSSRGNYIGLTVTVKARSRAHLDDIYQALTGHPLVKVVL